MIFISIGQCRTNFNPAVKAIHMFVSNGFFLSNEIWQIFFLVLLSGRMRCLNVFLALYTLPISCSYNSVHTIRPVVFFWFVIIQPKNSLIVTWFLYSVLHSWNLLFCIGGLELLVPILDGEFIYYSFRLLFRFRKHFLVRIYFCNNAICWL